LITQIAAIRSGSGVHKSISTLAKINLIAKVKNAKYDGYRLTYGGLDYLALHTHMKSGTVYSVGNQIGVGKESDIYVCASPLGRSLVLKIHRLGRISFRTVKANRDYLRNRSSGSWMYMSRLAALKEYTFMQALRREGFPVPEPVGQSRHTVIMSLVDAFPLRQISSVPDPAGLYAELISMIVKFAQYGLIHGDFNEFNILIEEKRTASPSDPSAHNDEGEYTGPITLIPTIIDFPQMLSTSHPNAAYYFDRDVACIKRFFSRRFGFTSDEPGPYLDQSLKSMIKRLDVEVEATGFSKKMAKELEKYMKEVGVDGDAGGIGNEDGDSEDEIPDMEEEQDEEDLGEVEDVQQDKEDPDVLDLVPTEQDTSVLTSEMTILEIQDNDGEPAPSVADFKSQFSRPRNKPAKSAKAKAGWAI
jgi:RIO kinase 2